MPGIKLSVDMKPVIQDTGEVLTVLHQSATSTFQSDFINELVNATKTLSVIDTVELTIGGNTDTISGVSFTVKSEDTDKVVFRTSQLQVSYSGQITGIALKSGTKTYFSATVDGPNVGSGWKIVIDVTISWTTSFTCSVSNTIITGVNGWLKQSIKEVFGVVTRTGIWLTTASTYANETKIETSSPSRSKPASDTARHTYIFTNGGDITEIRIATNNDGELVMGFASAVQFVDGVNNKLTFDVKLTI